MSAEHDSDKKKKRSPRRRMLILGLLIALIPVIVVFGRQVSPRPKPSPTYLQAFEGTTKMADTVSPDGSRYGTVCACGQVDGYTTYLVDDRTGQAYLFRSIPASKLRSIRWSADSRYAVLYWSDHYGSGGITIFDMDAGHDIAIKDYSPCAMPSMSECDSSQVLAFAPKSPLILTYDGTWINLSDGSHHRLYPEIPGFPLQVQWQPSERRLFLLMGVPDYHTYKTASLVGYFADKDGTNAVEALSVTVADERWNTNPDFSQPQPPTCFWNVFETGVDCILAGQHYSLIDNQGTRS